MSLHWSAKLATVVGLSFLAACAHGPDHDETGAAENQSPKTETANDQKGGIFGVKNPETGCYEPKKDEDNQNKSDDELVLKEVICLD